MADNYELQMQYAAKLFLEYDQKAIIRRLSLKSDSQSLYVRFLGEDYAVDRFTGAVTKADSKMPASFGAALTIYDYICRDTPIERSTGRKSPINSRIHQAHPGVGESSMYEKYTRAFDAAPDKFKSACLSLGGREYPRGDAAYEFQVFDGLELVVQLWLSDEEFPPRLCLLWDENVLDKLMYETTWYACGVLLEKILIKMG